MLTSLRSVLTASVIALTVSSVWAEEPRSEGGVTVTSQKISNQSEAFPLRASAIIGMSVRNADNKSLGTINDFVVDLKSSQIRYLAVSYGGFLGLGDKLFAVPASAFQVHRDTNSTVHYLILDLPEDHLKQAPGFDHNKWPDFANAQWQQEVDDYYLNRVESKKVPAVK